MSHDTDPAGSLCKQNASSLVVTGSLGGGGRRTKIDTSKSQDPEWAQRYLSNDQQPTSKTKGIVGIETGRTSNERYESTMPLENIDKHER